jgi:hypothetical protein
VARTKAQATGKKYASVGELIADLSPEMQAEFARLRAVEDDDAITRTTDARGVLSPELLAELEEDHARFREGTATAQAD